MKQFIRNFNKQKVVGILNIGSLSLGTMVAIIIGLWTINELSFDSFHKNNKQIYRIVGHFTMNDAALTIGSTYWPFGEAAKAEIPAVEDIVRIYPIRSDIQIDNVSHSQARLALADANFFSFFHFPLKEGDPATVLSAPDKIVISESAAVRYFPGKNPVGQTLSFNKHNFTVSGIMEDMPQNSSLQTDFVFPPFGSFVNQEWGTSDVYITFLRIPDATKIEETEKALAQIAFRHLGPLFEKLNAFYTLQALSDIHFGSGTFFNDALLRENKTLVMVFALVALVILVISCINFTNLFISTSFLRAKTIGIKKSHGADKKSLVIGFYIETACYVLISIAIGIFFACLTIPVFNNFTQSKLTIDFLSPGLYLFLVVLLIVTVLLAGTFPAFFMTGFNPIQTLGGKFKGKSISIFQKSLIIVQFTASIALLIVVSFMQKQVHFILHYDLGFNKENIIYVQGRKNFAKNYDALKDELLKNPSITDISMKNSLPTQWQQGWGIANAGSDELTVMEINYVKPNYFDFMGMKIIEGENPFLLESNPGDSVIPVVINESAQKYLGLKNPIDQIIIANGRDRMIIKGLMRNAHIRSLRDEVDPQVYMKTRWHEESPVFVKVNGDPQNVIDILRAKWQEMEPNYPFEYHFLDDTYKDLYQSEMNTQNVMAFAMLITFIISVGGLFAMAFYATQRRIKEIGIRKINGATLKDLLLLLNKDFVIWVFLSFILAMPIAYWGLHSWLEGFKVKTPLSLWVFLLVGIIALTVTLLTTSFQTWQVATMNPVKTLKNE